MENDLETRLQEALSLVESQKMECARLTNELSELGRRHLECKASLMETRRELEETRRELADYGNMDRQLAEFDKMLSGVEEMKKGYEKKIRVLESRLRDAKIKAGRADDDELLDTISMTASPTPARPGANPQKPQDARKSPAAPRENPDVRRDPARGPHRENPDEWLQFLPPDL